MERQGLLEILRMILIAFVIAFVINLFRVAIFTDWDDAPRFENITEPEPAPAPIEESNNINTGKNTPHINTNIDDNGINIILTPMENFSGLSKARILEKRIDAMRTSLIFSQMNYSPNQSVYQITDGLPWISAEGALHWSKSSNEEKINGVSRDSIGILNPELLYFVSISENEDVVDSNFNTLYKDFYFVPYQVNYNPKNKTIIARIKNNKRNERGKNNYQPICLADSNAHDLGYKYAHMDSYENIGFYSESPYKNNTLASGIKETTGYYMHGSACGIPGGCNNYAPYWQYYNYFYIYDFPAKIHIKLWKNRPQSVEQQADISYLMIFE